TPNFQSATEQKKGRKQAMKIILKLIYFLFVRACRALALCLRQSAPLSAIINRYDHDDEYYFVCIIITSFIHSLSLIILPTCAGAKPEGIVANGEEAKTLNWNKI